MSNNTSEQYSKTCVQIMAKPYGRRCAFVILAVFQGLVAASYLRKYQKGDGWYFIAVLFLPPFLVWKFLWQASELTRLMRWSFVVWFLHVGMGLGPATGLIFGFVVGKPHIEATYSSLVGFKTGFVHFSAACTCFVK